MKDLDSTLEMVISLFLERETQFKINLRANHIKDPYHIYQLIMRDQQLAYRFSLFLLGIINEIKEEKNIVHLN